MKTRLFVGVAALAVVVLAGGWLLGDDKKPDDPKVKGQLPPHFKKLGLSDKQIQEIYKIESSYHEKIEPLQQKIDDLKQAEHLDIENVLTDDQRTHLKEILTSEVPDKDKTTPPPDKDKPAPPPDKDKTPPPPPKDK